MCSIVGYPRVDIPSSWDASAAFPPSHWPGASTHGHHHPKGYSEAHSQYAFQRELWAKKSYPNLGETMAILIQILHEIPGKPKGHLVQVRTCSFFLSRRN